MRRSITVNLELTIEDVVEALKVHFGMPDKFEIGLPVQYEDGTIANGYATWDMRPVDLN